MSKVTTKSPKPWWWKPLWIVTLLATIASAVAGYFLLDVSLARAVVGVALTFLGIGFALLKNFGIEFHAFGVC